MIKVVFQNMGLVASAYPRLVAELFEEGAQLTVTVRKNLEGTQNDG